VEFEMRYDRWSRPLLTVLGAGPKRTFIRVVDGMLHIKFISFRIDVPLQYVRSARLLGERRRRLVVWAIGVHPFGDGWLINGSAQGVVELTFDRPVKPAKVPGGPLFAYPVRSLFISLTEPEQFIAALKPGG
jgi:hypothetical protein